MARFLGQEKTGRVFNDGMLHYLLFQMTEKSYPLRYCIKGSVSVSTSLLHYAGVTIKIYLLHPVLAILAHFPHSLTFAQIRQIGRVNQYLFFFTS